MNRIQYKIYHDNEQQWFKNDQYHRHDHDKAHYIAQNRHKEWCQYGKRHRLYGPAVKRSDGTKRWYLNGKRHREDGPAVIYHDGTKEWWLEGKNLTEQQFNQRIKKLSNKQ